MRYAEIRSMDISDGPYFRVGLYTQGCPFRCSGCHNSQTWDYQGGKEFTDATLKKIISLVKQPHIAGLSILGGEPLIEQNVFYLTELTKQVKLLNKTVWIWTGYTYEHIPKIYKPIVDRCDVMIDGQFVKELYDQSLPYSGSSNQRVIDLNATRLHKKIIPYRS